MAVLQLFSTEICSRIFYFTVNNGNSAPVCRIAANLATLLHPVASSEQRAEFMG